ncbi:MAG TPA: tetratricopeptide repeat protein, partial [Desulfarculaceae bacterium]|nr:tetratricopeptide repeat protein [Desulfarculaceae bacterium]
VGTATGAPIRLPAGGYLKDSRGQIVVPVPDFSSLKKVAANSGGSYLKIDASESAFQHLNRFPTHFPEKNRESSKVTGDQWLDRGPWLLIPLLLLAALSFRKGWILLIFMALLLPPEKAAAFSWQDLWQRPAQQAAEAFNTKDYDKAAGLSKDPDWQAAALYRAGKFKEAATALKSQESSLSHYNRGNALARSEALQEALTAYDKALAIDPGLEDASFNRDLVKELMQQQEQQKKEQQQQDSDDQQKSENTDKSESQEDSSKSQDSEKQQSDSQQSDSEKNENSDSSSKQQSSQEKDQEEKANNDSQAQATEKSNPEKKSEPQASAKPDKREQPETATQEEPAAAASENDEKPLDAEQQALKQWLRRIPDDPGGLLERKFLYQYRDRQDRSQGSKEW